MKICIIQSRSVKGEINQNIDNHLWLIRKGIYSKADLIIFPELSVTGYEPTLVEKLACHFGDQRFDVFQELADAPTISSDGIHISIIFFSAHQERFVYSKSILHEDEKPFFVSGKKQQSLISMKEKRVSFGICYETLQREHIVEAAKNRSDIYIASVAKPERGVGKAYLHFSSVAKEFGMPILMSNCVGYCDNFLSNGKSSIWSKEGLLVAQLDGVNQGYMIYDTELEYIDVFNDI